MRLKDLRLVKFRNYTDKQVRFHSKLNFIAGDNGTGKTSILEAIYFLAITKSFRTNFDSDVVKYGENYFQVFGNFSTEDENLLININYSKQGGKKLLVNKVALKKLSDIIGKVPVVILSPGSQRVTEGSPSIRRNFINKVISQVDRAYLDSLVKYRFRLAQRNRLLVNYQNRGKYTYDRYVETYDEILAASAEAIYEGRKIFLENYSPIFKELFGKVSHIKHSVDIDINFNIKLKDKSFKEAYLGRMRESFRRSVELGRTICGPHYDEVAISLDGKDIRYAGSQGEHKITLVALKMAEGEYLKRHLDEPIFLMDDLFALLDVKHCSKVIKELNDDNQTIITSTSIKDIKDIGLKNGSKDCKIIKLPVGRS